MKMWKTPTKDFLQRKSMKRRWRTLLGALWTTTIGLMSGAQAEDSTEVMNRVVIVCISGFNGSTESGMKGLCDLLRTDSALMNLGVNADNIFRRNWNKSEDSNPSAAPDVDDIVNEINARTLNPSYLALIGHSFGGWAASKISRRTTSSGFKPNFVALIDPVFGPFNGQWEGNEPQGNFIRNWYQSNMILVGDTCTVGQMARYCGPTENGLVCGYRSVLDATNQEEEFLKDWDGNREREKCLWGHVHVPTAHTNMDDNQWIWHQIYDQLISDLRLLKAEAEGTEAREADLQKKRALLLLLNQHIEGNF